MHISLLNVCKYSKNACLMYLCNFSGFQCFPSETRRHQRIFKLQKVWYPDIKAVWNNYRWAAISKHFNLIRESSYNVKYFTWYFHQIKCSQSVSQTTVIHTWKIEGFPCDFYQWFLNTKVSHIILNTFSLFLPDHEQNVACGGGSRTSQIGVLSG